MIGLVLVSHSAQLAEGVRELAHQMTQGRVPIAAAGGVDDKDNPIGTDPMKVLAAVESVYSEDGVVILMDLGSALMSAETALEFIEPTRQGNIHLCDAPFVEGAISAAIQASVGSPMEVVLAEARASLQMKQQHLAPSGSNSHELVPPAALPGESADSLRIVVPNALGIHARPAAKLVALAGQYAAKLTIQKGERFADAHSINQVALLDARHGDELCFFAEGADARQALLAVRALADDNFGDHDKPLETPQEQHLLADDVLVGVAASKGLAIGRIYRLHEQTPDIPPETTDDTEGELKRFVQAVDAAGVELHQLVTQSAKQLGEAEAGIFEAHLMMLRDDDLLNTVRQSMMQARQTAAAAWWATVEALAARYRQTDNAYLQARAADILDVGKRVLRQLSPAEADAVEIEAGSILAAPDLSPSDTARLDPGRVAGIVTQQGGATSHTAIIARSLGIPAVVGIGAGYAQLADGQIIIVDGDNGWIHHQPTPGQIETFQQKQQKQQEIQAALLQDSSKPAVTLDHHRVEVAANIGKAADANNLLTIGAEGVGLFRTELLFMNRQSAPDEEQQFEAYTAAAQNLGGCPVIIRTLDVGGDKAIDYIHIEAEENPFLGYRGIRYWLDNTELAYTQLCAICRASAEHPVKVMFPMVGTLEELQRAKQLLQQVHADLFARAAACNAAMQVGMMIEVPSAVLTAGQFADHVDFFSIGTNDLTQYLMAADRGNARVNSLATPFQPAVIHAIKQVVDAAHAKGKWVGICGEMAGNPVLTPLLVGLGVDELSMSAPSIPEVKAIIRQISYQQAREIAAHVLVLSSAAQVETYLMSSRIAVQPL